MEKKTIGYIMPVYVLTKTGDVLSDERVKVVRDLVLGDTEGDPNLTPEVNAMIKSELPPNTTGVLIHSGVDLLDPAFLAELLEADLNSRLIISRRGLFVGLQCGPDEESGLPPIISDLKEAAERGIDSWTVIDEHLPDDD